MPGRGRTRAPSARQDAARRSNSPRRPLIPDRHPARRGWKTHPLSAPPGPANKAVRGAPRPSTQSRQGGTDVDDGSPGGRHPCALDQRRAQLRRRLGGADGGHPAEHRGDRPRRPARTAEDRRALAADRLRVRSGRRRGRLHRVVLQGRSGRTGAVRAGRRGIDPQRGDQARGLLVRLRQQPRDRAADDDERMAGPPHPEGPGGARRRHVRHLRRHPRDGRQPDRRDGRPGLPGVELEVEGRHPDRLRPGMPDPPGQPLRDDPLPALPGDRARRR